MKNKKVSKQTTEEYDALYLEVISGQISTKEWEKYCDRLLNRLLADSREILKRLKEEA